MVDRNRGVVEHGWGSRGVRVRLAQATRTETRAAVGIRIQRLVVGKLVHRMAQGVRMVWGEGGSGREEGGMAETASGTLHTAADEAVAALACCTCELWSQGETCRDHLTDSHGRRGRRERRRQTRSRSH